MQTNEIIKLIVRANIWDNTTKDSILLIETLMLIEAHEKKEMNNKELLFKIYFLRVRFLNKKTPNTILFIRLR